MFFPPANPNALPANGPNAFSAASGVPENIESGIWNLQSGSNALTPTWINPDGCKICHTIDDLLV